jgi:hypothetical protein
MQDRQVLEALPVRLDARRPLRSASVGTGHVGLHMLARMQPPRIVQVAADLAGNGGACMLSATVVELRCAARAGCAYPPRHA